jgi:hypothetical protein
VAGSKDAQLYEQHIRKGTRKDTKKDTNNGVNERKKQQRLPKEESVHQKVITRRD